MQLDAIRSRQAKEQGMQLSLDMGDEDWPERLVAEFRGWAARQQSQGVTTFRLEQFRAEAANQPQSHKSWGSAPRLLQKAGLIAPLLDADGYPVRRPAAAVKTHAHPVIVYRLLGVAA